MTSQKLASQKTSKSGPFSDEGFLRHPSAQRFLLANLGGAAILGAITSLHSFGDDYNFSYEITLVVVGVVLYFYLLVKDKKQQVKASRGKGSKARVDSSTERPSQPRQSPVFSSVGWEAEISELLRQVSPTASSDAILLTIVDNTKADIKSIVPEAKVSAFTSVNLVNNTDVGALEVDVSIELDPGILVERMEACGLGRWLGKDRTSTIGMQHDDLAKLTLRMLTKKLAVGGFYLYRRFLPSHCAYKEREPTLTLRVPECRDITDRDIFVNFSVNCPTPARLATLGKQLKLFDVRAYELGLLVRRWARERGMAYTPKGCLSPYAWTCLVCFFLQQRRTDAFLKPAFGSGHEEQHSRGDGVGDVTVGEVFREFLHFYANFQWSAGVISLRLGRQIAWQDSPTQLTKAAKIVLAIEDPFESNRNAAETLTPPGFQHLVNELTRARNLLGLDDSDKGRNCVGLKHLLEAWVPPPKDQVKSWNPDKGPEAANVLVVDPIKHVPNQPMEMAHVPYHPVPMPYVPNYPKTTAQVHYGTVKGYDDTKGWGHIECQETRAMYGKDMFFMRRALQQAGGEISIQLGEQVQFSVTNGVKGIEAKKIYKIISGTIGASFLGTVKRYNAEKGFGFVACEQTYSIYDKDLFLHRKDLSGWIPNEGDAVRFTLTIAADGRPEATGAMPPGQFSHLQLMMNY